MDQRRARSYRAFMGVVALPECVMEKPPIRRVRRYSGYAPIQDHAQAASTAATGCRSCELPIAIFSAPAAEQPRSEERRVGKEGRARRSPPQRTRNEEER